MIDELHPDSEERPIIAEKIVRLRVGQIRVVVGTVYKDMPSRPSVVDEFAGAYTSKALETRIVVSSADDTLSLEDETGRVELTRPKGASYASLPVGSFVTGVVMAAKGVVLADGSLQVHDFCFPQMQLPVAPSSASPPGGIVMIVSGLNYGSATRAVARQLLWDFVTGSAGAGAGSGARICRVIIAGGLVAPSEVQMGSKFLTTEEQELLAEPVKEADAALSAVAPSVPIDLMPGASDPGSSFLPQQPLHGVLLPLCQKYVRFNRVTNPHHCEIGGVTFMGHSGQPIEAVLSHSEAQVLALPDVVTATAAPKAAASSSLADSSPSSSSAPVVGEEGASEAKYDDQGDEDVNPEAREFADELPTAAETRLNCLENCLRWQILAPNAPDGLACYPYKSDDPFVMDKEDAPHVFFAGNQPAFAVRAVRATNPLGARASSSSAVGEAVKVVLVPRFAETGQAVLVDLATRAVSVMCFHSALGDEETDATPVLAGYDEGQRAEERAIVGVKLRRTPSASKPIARTTSAAAATATSAAAAVADDDEEPLPQQEDEDEDEDEDNDMDGDVEMD